MAAIRKRIVVIDGNITMDVTVYFGDMFSDISLAVMWLVATLTEGQARVNTESSKKILYKEVNKMRFYVEYCFRNTDTATSDGKWHTDVLDNNGKYFTEEEAERIAKDIMEGSVCDIKWAEVVPYDDRGDYSPYAVDHDKDEDMRMGIDYSPSCPWNAPGMSISDFI